MNHPQKSTVLSPMGWPVNERRHLTVGMANPLGSKDSYSDLVDDTLVTFLVQNAFSIFQHHITQAISDIWYYLVILSHPCRVHRRSLKLRTWSASFPNTLSLLAMSPALRKSDRLPGNAPPYTESLIGNENPL